MGARRSVIGLWSESPHNSLIPAQIRIGHELPLLRERVFHVTSRERLQSIAEAGFIQSNRDGSLGNTYGPSAISLGRSKGFVCLFDLRNQTEEAIQWGLGCFYFLAPRPLGDELAFFLLAPAAYPQLVLADDIKSLVETGTFRIPKVECWFPADIPLSAVEGVLIVHVVRRPDDPHSLEALLSDLVQSAADERFKEVQRAMPALIAEMKEDLAREKFVREFVVLPTRRSATAPVTRCFLL